LNNWSLLVATGSVRQTSKRSRNEIKYYTIPERGITICSRHVEALIIQAKRNAIVIDNNKYYWQLIPDQQQRLNNCYGYFTNEHLTTFLPGNNFERSSNDEKFTS
jgi:hypothetical protein